MPKWVFVVVHNRVVAIVEPKKREFYFHTVTLCLVDLSQTFAFIFLPYICSYGGDFFLDQRGFDDLIKNSCYPYSYKYK